MVPADSVTGTSCQETVKPWSLAYFTQASSAACDRLIQQALDRGGRDNVTVIVAAYEFPD